MPVIQQTDKVSFGSGRLFAVPAGGGARYKYGDLTDISLDLKIEQKEAYGEKAYAIAIADGHRGIDISAKHYTLRLDAFANDMGLASPAAGINAFAYDELVTVPGSVAYTFTLAQGATLIAGTVDLVMLVKTNGVFSPITYKFVTAGTEVAGQSCSITNAGVITFASGDSGLTGYATYQYTTANGSSVTISNVLQNTTPSYQMVLVKKDRSPIDGSSGQLIFTLNAVRPGGIKMQYKEGEFTVYDRMFKAFSDPSGNVGTLQFVNT
jgi:hypothetical protein